jgi:hypothetical protein
MFCSEFPQQKTPCRSDIVHKLSTDCLLSFALQIMWLIFSAVAEWCIAIIKEHAKFLLNSLSMYTVYDINNDIICMDPCTFHMKSENNSIPER